ncbi:ribosomal large subunit biogenesis-related protein [Trichosporon asahii var. asahii CBS 2479]|uniref:Nucleolar protein 16 n=1 Tax=Trichosporon asahii var. asahii (strain ATCC 90039 / CBS 2479 / JCM 2466 / KCTC 7840 / NBRC 103889/ NCYC 2677 / UAMH 7654) TaxID=1186058 RepID=J4UIK6_TRIAS|nr:ribosomal large subunit biogenesis-related protein [Trichosporon asahii var. asahii CBS 2479]EJT51510.1 ribosomal large subunit biogenesis-related protein [Trichosporon asahii var. asahii CBS 2479]
MANPRQRAKSRSGKSTKPNLLQKRRLKQKLRKAHPLFGPETLQNAWDRKKTVFQNYAALGLLPSIPLPENANAKVQLPTQSLPEGAPSIGFGRIVRDEEGNVIDIIIDGEEDEKEEKEEDKRWGKPLNPEEDEFEKAPVQAKTQVVRADPRPRGSRRYVGPGAAHTSAAEGIWLTRLVHKHGDDFSRAALDRKLNVWQKTPGELKRMVRKAGGVEKLQAQPLE